MKNATPKSEPLPKNKEERIQCLSKFDDALLKDTLTLLKQLKREGIGRYSTAEYEIKGLDNSNVISWALLCINPLYRDLPMNWKNLSKFDPEKIFENGKLVKLKIKAEGDITNYPVFYLSGFTEGSKNYAERTFMPGLEFETAMSEIKEVLEKKNRYLILEQDIFLYNESRLNIQPDSYGYIILRNIYNILNGKSGDITYKDLAKILSEEKKFKGFSNEKIIEKIRKYATSHTEGVGLKIKEKEKNNKPLISVKYGNGIIFNNN